ncbi:hypothetical protein [Bacillus pumilus]|uniref:hypothetical protein n=1 Tax=Bacillus pumilus TaxID=1408 RepID=UPI0011A4F379|nr:hypothetical protein [Bacillus pumilus]
MNSGSRNRNSESNNNDISLVDLTKSMYEMIENVEGNYIHFNMFHALGKQNVTLTVSVVNEIKPTHLVLDELIDWLTKTKNHEVLEKIEALQEDMSFMDESDAPVVTTRNDTEFHYTRNGNVHTISIERP